MPRFRHKPTIVDAVQWDGTKGEAQRLGLQWLAGNLRRVTRGWFVGTLEGPLYVSPNDWIVTGLDGQRCPIKPDIFEATYDEVEETQS